MVNHPYLFREKILGFFFHGSQFDLVFRGFFPFGCGKRDEITQLPWGGEDYPTVFRLPGGAVEWEQKLRLDKWQLKLGHAIRGSRDRSTTGGSTPKTCTT